MAKPGRVYSLLVRHVIERPTAIRILWVLWGLVALLVVALGVLTFL